MKIGRTRLRAIVLATAVAVTAGTLVGCSSSTSGSDGAGTTLTLFTYVDAPTTKALKAGLVDFTKQTKIKVVVDDLPGSGAAIYPGKLKTELAGGKGPDIWQIWGGSIGKPFADNGFAADLTQYFKQYGWGSKIPATTVDGMKWNGKSYGLPLTSITVTAWYSKAAFAKAGISAPPTTYAELTADNDKLVASGQVPVGLGGKYGWDVMRLFEYLLEKDAGPTLHDKLLAGTASWDNPAVVKAFTELREWSTKGWLPQGVMGLDPSVTEPGFTQGTYAYTIAGGWADSSYIQKAADPSAYGTFALPTDQNPNRHSGWVEGYMINAASKNQAAAAKLLNYLAEVSTQKKIQNTSSSVKGAGPSATTNPTSVENAKIAASAPFYTIQDQALSAEDADGYFAIQSQVVQGAVDPAAAATQMQAVMVKGKSGN
jgi:raffinose/stachyose/melibiose transport system substrate-binding protein